MRALRHLVVLGLVACAAACGLSVTGVSTTNGDASASSSSSTSSTSSTSTSTSSSSSSSSGDVPDAAASFDADAACTDPVLRFDGTSGFGLVPDAPALDLTGNFTVEAWIRPTRATGEMHIVSHHNHNGNTGWVLLLKEGRLELRVYVSGGDSPQTAGNTTTLTNVVPNAWAFVAGTWDGSTLRVYMDGELLETEGVSVTRNDYSGGLVIGRAAYDMNLFFFSGEIDDVRLSNVARYTGATAEVPTTRLPIDAATIALWRFDEAPGVNASFANAAGATHSGKLFNAAQSALADCVERR